MTRKIIGVTVGTTLNPNKFVDNSKLNEQIANSVNEYLKENPISIPSEHVAQNNLFDKDNLVTSFVKSDGTTVTGTFTNYIKIEANKRYVTNLNYTQFHFFDENKTHLSTTTYLANPQVITGNGGYLLVKLGNDYSDALVLEGTDIEAYHESYTKLKNDFNKWFGKKWLCIGDSISTDESNLAKNGYAKLISRELGINLTNIAVSGKVMKDGYEWLDGCSNEYDLITVMLGTNNHGYNCGIGALNDEHYTNGSYSSNNSFYAQTQLMVEKLKAKYPKSVIMFLTPIKRSAPSGNNNDEGYQINALNLTTEAYRDVIIDVCNYYSIPCIDLFNAIDSRTETDRTLYFMSAEDGTHPNDLGHALFLAPLIKDGIEKHAPYYFNDWETVEDDTTEDGGNSGEDTGGSDSTEPMLIHSYTSTPVEFTANDTTYTMLEDTTNDLDLKIGTYWKEVKGVSMPNTKGYYVERSRPTGDWKIEKDTSFSVKFINYNRNSNYFSQLAQLNTGSLGGFNVNQNLNDGTTLQAEGRFRIVINAPSGSTSVFGDGVLLFENYMADGKTINKLYGTSVFKNKETHDITITFDVETKNVKVYQDTDLVIDEILDVNLRFDGIILGDLTYVSFESLEIYKGVITVS